MTRQKQGRRQFIQTAGIGIAASLTGVSNAPAQAESSTTQTKSKQQFELGLASYTLRNFDLDQTLEMTKRVGLKFICFKDMHLPLDSSPQQIADIVEKVKEAKLELYAGGVIYMKNEILKLKNIPKE